MRQKSVRRLIDVAATHHLITDYYVSPGLVQLYVGDIALAFDPDEATVFLATLLDGHREAQQLLAEGPALLFGQAPAAIA